MLKKRVPILLSFILPLLAVILLMGALRSSVQAAVNATITVANTNDSGAGSLRQAISNTVAGGTINFEAPLAGETITLSTQLVITKNLSITGNVPITISGNDSTRVFYIDSADVTLDSLTIANGNTRGDGGGLYLESAVVTLTNSFVISNTAGYGGGIESVATVLSIDNSSINNNMGFDGGGGIDSWGGSSLVLTNSFVQGNSTDGYGGGIENVNSVLSIDSSTINNNMSFDGGGGIDSWDGSSLVLTNSFVQGNSTYYVGGGIWSDGGTFALTDTVVSENMADYQGGGLWSNVNGTISGGVFENNFAYEQGGAIYYGYEHEGGEILGLSEGTGLRDYARGRSQLMEGTTAVITPTLTMTNVTIISNTATMGGGLFSELNTIINGGQFANNYADYAGGAIYYGEAAGGEISELVEGVTAVLSPTLTMSNVDVISNTSGYVGGGLASSDSTAISGGQFANNYADYAGGAIYYGEAAGFGIPDMVEGVTAVLSPTLTMTNVTVINNEAYIGGGLFNELYTVVNGGAFESNFAYGGGGIFNGIDEGEGVPSLEGLTKSDTSLNYWGKDGDGVDLQAGVMAVSVPSITLTDVDVIGNVADIGGGSANVSGMMTINSSAYISNTGGIAGGAESSFGILSITDSIFSSNTADQFGGGIATQASLVTITNSTLISNTAGYGGGVYGQFFSDHTILNSMVMDNLAVYSGGGIYVIGDTALIVEETAVVNNTAEYERGGGIYIRDGVQAELLNSTISGNQTVAIEGTFGDLGNGGGIYVGAPIPDSPNVITVTHSTITNNYAAGEGGGMDFNRGAPGDILTFQNSILAGNSAAGLYQDCYDYGTVNYTFNSDAYNIFSGATDDDCPIGATDISLAGLGLTIADVVNPLADNGGNTLTHALIDNSPALDTDDTNCLPIDQRGIARPQNIACDTGAYEAVLYELTVGIIGSGTVSNTTGIDCGVDCSELYVDGTVVTLTATPAIGYSFTGWSGACTGATGCTVTMTVATHVTATFTIDTYDLTVGVVGSGVVSDTLGNISCGADCAETYDYGTVVTLTATPAIGYSFTGWSGDCGGTADCAVTMTTTAHVTATFSIYHIFLPIIMTPPGVPDLIVDSINMTADSLEVVIKNVGTGVTNSDPWGGFWVDLYVDPSVAPTMNQTWKTIGGEGLIWGVRTPLLPGESITLTLNGPHYDASESYFTGIIMAGSTVYGQVDAVGDPSFGAVLESDETNNIMGPIITTIDTTPSVPLTNGVTAEGLMPKRP